MIIVQKTQLPTTMTVNILSFFFFLHSLILKLVTNPKRTGYKNKKHNAKTFWSEICLKNVSLTDKKDTYRGPI